MADSNNAGFTGSGFANTNNATNATVRYKVNAATAVVTTQAELRAQNSGSDRVAGPTVGWTPELQRSGVETSDVLLSWPLAPSRAAK